MLTEVALLVYGKENCTRDGCNLTRLAAISGVRLLSVWKGIEDSA